MKINSEVKVGILGFITLAVVLFAFNYLNRENVFSRNLIITAQFDDLNFIRKNSKVFVKGREVGKVVAIYADGDRYNIDMDIEPDTRLPESTTALITELSLMGGHMVDLRYNGTCLEDCLQSGDIISGSVSDLKGRIAEQARPILERVGAFADSLSGPNGMDHTLAKAHASLEALRKNMGRLQGNLKSADIPSNARYYRRLSDALLSKEGELPEDLKSAKAMAVQLERLLGQMGELNQADIDSMVQVIYTAREAAQKVPTQLQNVDQSLSKVNTIIDSLQYGLRAYQPGARGTVPRLLYNEAMRDSTQQSIREFGDHLIDIRLHPERHLNL